MVNSSGGTPYVALRPLLADFTLSMGRGAAVVYPKDAAQIIALADIFPGARVLEAGAGSGALSCWLLRAIGEDGLLVSYERRPDFAEIARGNVERFFGGPHPAWRLGSGTCWRGRRQRPGDAPTAGRTGPRCRPEPAPGLRIVSTGCTGHARAMGVRALAADALIPGGVLCCYVATATQLSRTVESMREQGSFDEPAAWESMVRGWHVDGLAVRPEHRMVGPYRFSGHGAAARRGVMHRTSAPRAQARGEGFRRDGRLIRM